MSKFAEDNDVYFEFHSNYCAVKSQVTNEVLLQRNVGSNGLYSFPHIQFQPSTGVASYCLSSSVNSSVNSCNKNANFIVNPCNRSSNLWHDRLGHPNHHVLQLVLKHCNIPTVNKNLISFCSTCAAGKSHRLPSSPSTSVYSSPLELIYSDLWGPSHVTSTNGFLYYIDAFYRFTWICLLKSKAETFTVFKKFKAMAELQFNTKLKSLQTD